jgi:hypothetical protein
LGKGVGDAPLNFLIDSTANPKVKTMEGEGIGGTFTNLEHFMGIWAC